MRFFASTPRSPRGCYDEQMRSYALALGSVLLCSPLWSCSADRDYQVAVSWTLNGMVPSAQTCQEQNIARGRFEVTTASGKQLQTLESDCAGIITLSDGHQYGGFLTTHAFVWDRTYNYTVTLVDATGAPRSMPGHGSFQVPFDSTDIYEISFLDYLNPNGSAAALSGEWSVAASTDLTAACTANRVSKVRVMVASALDPSFENPMQVGEANCSDGRFASSGKVLATGNYLFEYVAVSDGGNVVETGTSLPVFVDGTRDIALPRQMFLSKAAPPSASSKDVVLLPRAATRVLSFAHSSERLDERASEATTLSN